MLSQDFTSQHQSSSSIEVQISEVENIVRNLFPVSYTHLRAHETPEHLVCRLLLEKQNPSSSLSSYSHNPPDYTVILYHTHKIFI